MPICKILQLKIIWQNKGRGKISIGVECKAIGLRPIGCYVTSIKKKKKSQWKCVLDKSGWCSQPKWMVERAGYTWIKYVH